MGISGDSIGLIMVLRILTTLPCFLRTVGCLKIRFPTTQEGSWSQDFLVLLLSEILEA